MCQSYERVLVSEVGQLLRWRCLQQTSLYLPIASRGTHLYYSAICPKVQLATVSGIGLFLQYLILSVVINGHFFEFWKSVTCELSSVHWLCYTIIQHALMVNNGTVLNRNTFYQILLINKPFHRACIVKNHPGEEWVL